MPLVEVNGVRIEYRMDVSADLPVVLLSNSLSTTFQMWDGQMKALVDRFSVLRWNKRGHGASSAPPPPYTLRQLTEDVRGLLSVLDIDRVHFVGLSTGGAIGQLFAATYPEMTRTLTLCDTSSYVPPEVWDSRIANARANGMEGVADASMERWFTPEFRRREPRIVERFRQMVLETDIDGYIGCASSLKQRMLKPLLKTIRSADACDCRRGGPEHPGIAFRNSPPRNSEFRTHDHSGRGTHFKRRSAGGVQQSAADVS